MSLDRWALMKPGRFRKQIHLEIFGGNIEELGYACLLACLLRVFSGEDRGRFEGA